ncbi:MAG: DUF6596 domain-containing protein [Rhizobiaceae bacterium]
MSQNPKARAAEVARVSYGKLLAVLAKQTRDIALAEDALAEAFTRALETWPHEGTPEKPEAWLLTTARNKMRDQFKSAAHQTSVSLDDIEPVMNDLDPHNIPDERLQLLFVCAHPAIDENIRTPLMLQTVLGLEAAQIASAFLVPSTAMAQRLVRAKKKIKAAHIPFIVPEKSQMSARLEAVLEAIYGAFSIEINDTDSNPNDNEDLGLEALYLADLLVELLPNEAEVLGLAALLNYAASRRINSEHFTPLKEQNPATWNTPRAERADNLLARAKEHNKLGRFQIEAAIQSVHSQRRFSGTTDWVAIVQLYEGLLHLAPTIGAVVAQASAIGEAHNAKAGLARLGQIDPKTIENHQTAWATRAHLLAEAGDNKNARTAFDKAISLTSNTKVRAYLEARLALIQTSN